MKAAILHISDIHFQAARTNPVMGRPEAIVAALRSADPLLDGCIVAVTGDIAFSGKDEEYALANQFFKELRTSLERVPGFKFVRSFLVPGNHDCDFGRSA